jgi:tetratricopeptide (TPR) repeat protein
LVERDEIVGYHLEQAYRYRTELVPADEAAEPLAARAAELLTVAGWRARDRGDFPGAVALLSRAADLYGPGRLALLPGIAELLYLFLGDFARAAELLDEAAATARARGEEAVTAVATVLRADLASRTGDASTSLESVAELADEAAGVLERIGDDTQLALVLYIAARQRVFLGRSDEAVRLGERGLELARRAGDLHRARGCLVGMIEGRAQGTEPVSEVVAFLQDMSDELRSLLAGSIVVQMSASLMACYSGHFAEARDELAEAQRVARESGNRVWRAATALHRGKIELHAGNVAEAALALRDGHDLLGELGAGGARTTSATLLADALLRLGRDEEADEVLDVSDKIAHPDDPDPQVRSRAVRAQILAKRGDLAQAERLAHEAVEIAARTDFIVLHGDALLALAKVLRASGAAEESNAALQEALALFERKENVVKAKQTRELLSAAQTVGGDQSA